MGSSFDTVIQAFGNNAGIVVPGEVITALGGAKRPAVKVSVSADGRVDYDFATTIGAMGGQSLISFNKAHRDASGLAAGDQVRVTLEVDAAPREVDVPPALLEALNEAGVAEKFGALAPSKRKEFARQVAEAKAEETRNRRIAKVIESLS